MENYKGQKLYYRLLLINMFVMISNTIKMFAFCVYLLLFLLNVEFFTWRNNNETPSKHETMAQRWFIVETKS